MFDQRHCLNPDQGKQEEDRMTRGAYVGKLYPGRQSSYQDEEQGIVLVMSRLKILLFEFILNVIPVKQHGRLDVIVVNS